MRSVLLELLRHKTWATLRLIEFCQQLPPGHVAASAPGTYGSVSDTLRHLVAADQNYLRAFTSEDLGPPPPPEAGLEVLADRFRSNAPRWEAVFADASAPQREITGRLGTSLGVAPMAQSIHHADDHRTQVLTILGGRGLEVPDLDVWAYGAEAGYVRPTTPD
ncbi:MAG: hypothetical protein M3336_01185 [Chloroflexota bacterium]|nr:hypothetical protein [Chloroflexota bacterium]